MSPIEALSWILRKAQGATDIETGKVIDVGYEVQVIKLNIDADRHRLKQRIDEIDELERDKARMHAENERLRDQFLLAQLCINRIDDFLEYRWESRSAIDVRNRIREYVRDCAAALKEGKP